MDTFLLVQKESNLEKVEPKYKKFTYESPIIRSYPFIAEFGCQKIYRVIPNTLKLHYNNGIEICYIYKGKYDWLSGDENYTLYPGDTYVTAPWELHGSPKGFLDLGFLTWIIIKPKHFSQNDGLNLGDWSNLSKKDQKMISEIFKKREKRFFHDLTVGSIFKELYQELRNKKFGSSARVVHLIETLLINVARQFQQNDKVLDRNHNKDFELLRNKMCADLSYPWTVNEMADVLKVGVTNLTKKIKIQTGFTPTGYLINLRIENSKKLLSESKIRITDVALNCGFYSLQHFSDTFKKSVGIYPKEYRRLNKKNSI